ncbi:DUF4913 domain-containing protein [Nocardia suismassiliense]|uniref:DUF4913 domain-containing protein n=1 Tax=Nocardia suismassiliense TaxID=2077092 RepID=A0ABW6QQC0_9NOCA
MHDQQSPIYADVVGFVENYLSLVYRRQVNENSDTVWCPEWWQHAEAIARLDVVWRAWEQNRLHARTSGGMWLLEHADPHMTKLLDPRGPFRYCGTPNGHLNLLGPLPLKSPPGGMFRLPTAKSSETATGSGTSLVYGEVVDFVENYLSLVYRRLVNEYSDIVWCPEWWKHAEAIVRLDVVWRSWEHYRRDAGIGSSTWFLEHADPHMNRLFDQRGPFRYCGTKDGHQDMLGPLPLKSPPHDMFGISAVADSQTGTGDAVPTTFAGVVDFVENYLSLVYRRQVNENSDIVWCPEWWQHAEAIARLDALWRAWENYRLDARTGLSMWFLDHADLHMRRLFDRGGPFRHCGSESGHQDMLGPLPLVSPVRGS